MKNHCALCQQAQPLQSTAFNTQQSHSSRKTNMKGCLCVYTDSLFHVNSTVGLQYCEWIRLIDRLYGRKCMQSWMCVCECVTLLQLLSALDIFLMWGHTWSSESSSMPAWYAANQLIQLSFSDISLLHSICLVCSKHNKHTHSQVTHTCCTFSHHNRTWWP